MLAAIIMIALALGQTVFQSRGILLRSRAAENERWIQDLAFLSKTAQRVRIPYWSSSLPRIKSGRMILPWIDGKEDMVLAIQEESPTTYHFILDSKELRSVESRDYSLELWPNAAKPEGLSLRRNTGSNKVLVFSFGGSPWY